MAQQFPQPPARALVAVRQSYHWVNVWRYVVVRPPVKNTGLAAATFSNRVGLRVFPGITRLQAITMHSRPTVIEALAIMRWLGFIYRISRAQGTNSGQADSYQLCLPRSMAHVPIVTDGRLPAFADLTAEAQQTAIVLDVAASLLGASGKAGQPGGKARQPLVVAPVDYKWWSGFTPTTHATSTSNNTASQHADPHGSGSRASARADQDDASEDLYEQVSAALGDDLDPVEASTVDGMLANGQHPKAIINTIEKLRREAA